ncbi:MAG: glycosyl hydrolase-related protein, partial [Armatimonadota bacterium]
GLREYELYDDSNRTLAITLLRSVGILSGTGDIPHVQRTPGAQCLGENKARYAVFPHKGDWKQAKVWKEALNYQTPLRSVLVGDIDRSRTIETVEKTLPQTLSFVSISPDELAPSALKKEEEGGGIVLRCWNVQTDEVAGEVFLRGAKKAWKSNMAEERLEELSVTDSKIQIKARGREIVTLIFEV